MAQQVILWNIYQNMGKSCLDSDHCIEQNCPTDITFPCGFCNQLVIVQTQTSVCRKDPANWDIYTCCMNPQCIDQYLWTGPTISEMYQDPFADMPSSEDERD